MAENARPGAKVLREAKVMALASTYISPKSDSLTSHGSVVRYLSKMLSFCFQEHGNAEG
jgi:hypothetical protein